MRVDKVLSNFTKITRGVRQGCTFSPNLFSLYSEAIMREIKDMQGLIVGGHDINNLCYADTVLISESQDQQQKLLNKVVEASEAKRINNHL